MSADLKNQVALKASAMLDDMILNTQSEEARCYGYADDDKSVGAVLDRNIKAADRRFLERGLWDMCALLNYAKRKDDRAREDEQWSDDIATDRGRRLDEFRSRVKAILEGAGALFEDKG